MYKYKHPVGRVRSEENLHSSADMGDCQYERDNGMQVDIEKTLSQHEIFPIRTDSDTAAGAAEDRGSKTTVSDASNVIKTSPKKVSVSMGDVVTVKDNDTILSTRSLADCSALAILSGWDGSVYKRRTLMHLKGSSLELGLNDCGIYELLSKSETKLDGDGKVIWVAGTNSQSNIGIGMALSQMDKAGKMPLMKLLQAANVSVVIAGSSGIKIMANGTFELREGAGRGVLDKESIMEIFEDL
jgi:hypothetical protein